MQSNDPAESPIALIGERLKPGSITGWFHLLAVMYEIKLVLEGKDQCEKRKSSKLTLNGEKAARVEEVEKRLSSVVIKDADLLALQSGYGAETLKSVQAARDFAAEIVCALGVARDNTPGMLFSVIQNFRSKALNAADLHGFGELDDSLAVPVFFSYGGAISPERPRLQTLDELLDRFKWKLALRETSDF